MTGTYAWNPMPHVLAVRCPACGAQATFEFAEVVHIKLKADVAHFQKSRVFEYRLFPGPTRGGNWHGAIFYAGLHGSTAAIHELPPGYAPSDWAHSKYLYRRTGLDLGAVRCEACGVRRKHTLKWPDDAWYQLDHRGQVLWAFHRESAQALLDFIESKARKPKKHRWSSFLLHVPTSFLTAGARATVAKRLRRLLGQDSIV